MDCNYCKGICIKKGKYKAVQKYQCRQCDKYQREQYSQRRYDAETEKQIILLNNESVSISSISRLLQMPKSTVQIKLLKAGANKTAPELKECNQEYEVDELYTFVGKSSFPCYIMYAINRLTKQVIDVVIGKRSKENIARVIKTLMSLSPKRIYTDKLNIYSFLIPHGLHRTFQYKTNRIERKNLTLRTHLKRLGRKTICYSKSKAMLEACLRVYVWRWG